VSDLILSGDDNTPAMPMTEAEVNHLRRVLAWLRREMGQEPAEMVAMVNDMAAKLGPLEDPEGARMRLQSGYDHAASYPAYVRQGVKMLTKALRQHESRAGIVEAKT
jgi:hypothetical protein